jgi:hypothetical protein
MKIGKAQGIVMLVMGLVLLSAAILVLITVPPWGKWIADYYSTVDLSTLPSQSQAVAGGVKGMLGPLVQQMGNYMRTGGYFIGSLMSIISLAVCGVGLSIIRGHKNTN